MPTFSTGRPTWTWPEWRKAPAGTRFRHIRSGRRGTYLRPSPCRRNGAIVRWDGLEFNSNVVSPASDLEPIRYSAWDLIGFDGTTEVLDRVLGENDGYAEPGYEAKPAMIRLVGGRAVYEAANNNGGDKVRLARLDPDLGQIPRYVDADTQLEIVLDVPGR